MAKGAVFPVQFTGSKGVINCDESFQKNKVVEWHRYLRHARNNRETVSVSCLCQPVSTEGNILRLKVSHSEAHGPMRAASTRRIAGSIPSGPTNLRPVFMMRVWSQQAQTGCLKSGSRRYCRKMSQRHLMTTTLNRSLRL